MQNTTKLAVSEILKPAMPDLTTKPQSQSLGHWIKKKKFEDFDQYVHAFMQCTADRLFPYLNK